MNRLVNLTKNPSSSAIIESSIAMRDREERLSVLSKLDVPVLWLMGDQDSFIQLDSVYNQAAACNRSLIEVIPNTGHLSPFEKLEEFVAASIKFLDWIS